MGITHLLLLFSCGTSYFSPFKSIPLPRAENFYHFTFFFLTPDKAKEIILFSLTGNLIVMNSEGKVLKTYPFPKEVLASYDSPTSLFIISKDGIYRLSKDVLSPPAVLLSKRDIEGSFPISPTTFAVKTSQEIIIYNLSPPGIKELFSLPLPALHTGIRQEQYLYLAESSAIYKYLPKKGEVKKVLNLVKRRIIGDAAEEKILGLFNLGATLGILLRVEKDLYLIHYDPAKNNFPKKIPILLLRGASEVTATAYQSPPIILRHGSSLFSLNRLGFREGITSHPNLINFRVDDIDGDGLLELALLHKEGIEIFINQQKDLRKKREKAIENFLRSIKKERLKSASRYLFTAHILSHILGEDSRSLNILARRTYTNYYIKRWTETSLFFLVSLLPLFFILLLTKRIRREKRRLAKRAVREIVHLAYEVITLDHNFILKGNITAAMKKLQDLRERYHLLREEITSELWDEASYKKFLERFLHLPHLLPLKKFIDDRLKELGKSWECVVVTSEAEDVHLYIDPLIENIFTHIFSDHFRYSATFSKIIISYLHTTDWARRVKFSFLSDGATFPNLTKGHLAEDLQTLRTLYGNYISFGSEARASNEKLWVTFLDLAGIIKDIIAR